MRVSALLATFTAMRKSSIGFFFLLFSALVACDGNGNVAPDGTQGSATTIHITSGMAPALVAFRDGIAAAWQPATMTTATTFEAEVHGPYVVTVVCAALLAEGGGQPEAFTAQSARTPDDSHDLSFCDALPTRHTVSGHMVQAGFVQIGDLRDESNVDEWNFQIPVPSGSFDLIATTADQIAIRRAIAVTGDLTLASPVDVVKEGTALVDVAFTAPNAAPGETLSVGVGLLNPTTPNIPARIYLGPLATAKAAPDSALSATDVQSASVRATNGTSLRALRRPFRVGGNTAYMLPPPLGGVQWTVNGDQLSVSWTTLPDFDVLIDSAGGNAASGTTSVNYNLNMSSRFVAATGIMRITHDTDIPGFKPEWKINFAAGYDRGLTAQQGTETGVLTTSDVTEIVSAMKVNSRPTSRYAQP